MIIIPELRICYQNAPKIASSSAKSWLYKLIAGKEFSTRNETEFGAKNVHKYFNSLANTHASNIDIGQFSPADYPGYFVFAFTRDPIRRFLSMYANRVVHYKRLSEESGAAEKIRSLDLAFDPEINLFVDRMEAYMTCEYDIYHHTRPTVDFLGTNPGIYNSLADIKAFDKTVAEIQKHFEKIGRKDLAGVFPAESRYQTGGPKLGLEILNPWSFEFLVDYYRADYDTLPTLNLQETKDAYKKARDTAAAELATRVISLRKSILENQRNKQQDLEQDVATLSCPHVSFSRIHCDIDPERGTVVRGTVILSPSLSPADFSLHVVGNSTEVPARWGLATGNLAAKHAGNPNAATARFRAVPGTNSDGKLTVELRNTQGERWTIAEMDQSQAGHS